MGHGHVLALLLCTSIIIIIMLPNQAIASTPSAPRPSVHKHSASGGVLAVARCMHCTDDGPPKAV
jgi:hypothetical protein